MIENIYNRKMYNKDRPYVVYYDYYGSFRRFSSLDEALNFVDEQPEVSVCQIILYHEDNSMECIF